MKIAHFGKPVALRLLVLWLMVAAFGAAAALVGRAHAGAQTSATARTGGLISLPGPVPRRS